MIVDPKKLDISCDPKTVKEIYALNLFILLKDYYSVMLPNGNQLSTCVLCFVKSLTFAGICFECNVIGISREFINSSKTTDRDILNTLIHELSHAVVGVKHGHDDLWKSTNLQMGGDGQEMCLKEFREDYHFNYTIVCTNGCKHWRHRLRKDVWENRRCQNHDSPYIISKTKINQM